MGARLGRHRVIASALAAACLLALPASAGAIAWSAPTTLSPADEYAQSPQVAVDARGDAAIVWQRVISDFHTIVELSRRPAGGSFSAPITITEAAGQNESPSVAIGPDGQVLVVWSTEADEQYDARELIMASSGSASGGSFTAPEAISGYEGGNGWMEPRVGIADDGEALAVWKGLDDEMHYATRAPEARSFAAPRTIANPDEDVFDPSIAISPSGSAVVAWTGYHDVYAAVREAGGQFAAAQDVEAHACTSGDLHSAIDEAGTAVLDWSYDSTPGGECEVGGAPTWLRAVYRAPGGRFGAPVDAAEMEGWSRAGGAAVSHTGRVTVSALGKVLDPPSPGRLTAMTRLPGGSYGDVESISTGQPVEEPAALAYDGAGDLFAASDTRVYEEGAEEGEAQPNSGIVGNVAPADGAFASNSQLLQAVDDELDWPPSVAAAGEGQAVAVWASGVVGERSRVEASTAGPETPSSKEEGPSGHEEPASFPSPSSTESALSATDPESATRTAAASGVAGAIASRPALGPRQLTVSGRAGRSTEVLVRLIRDGHVLSAVRARLSRSRFQATLSLAGLSSGRYRIQIERRRGRSQHTETRWASVT